MYVMDRRFNYEKHTEIIFKVFGSYEKSLYLLLYLYVSDELTNRFFPQWTAAIIWFLSPSTSLPDSDNKLQAKCSLSTVRKSSRSKGPLFKPHQRGRGASKTQYPVKARLLDIIWCRRKRPLDTIHPDLNWYLNCNNNSNKSLSWIKDTIYLYNIFILSKKKRKKKFISLATSWFNWFSPIKLA